MEAKKIKFSGFYIYENGEQKELSFNELVDLQRQGYEVQIKIIKPAIVIDASIAFEAVSEEESKHEFNPLKRLLDEGIEEFQLYVDTSMGSRYLEDDDCILLQANSVRGKCVMNTKLCIGELQKQHRESPKKLDLQIDEYVFYNIPSGKFYWVNKDHEYSGEEMKIHAFPF